jgi:hypothetical protein
MDWRTINLHGAASISRVVGVFEVQDLRGVPWTKYKIKILERGVEDFIAIPNVCVKSGSGVPEWISGLGRTDVEALQDIIKRFGEMLTSRTSWRMEDFEWSDPHDF